MLVVYKVEIDIERTGLSDDSSIGFQNGIYHFSTAPLTGYYDCLDGNSFSDISQENMIIKGGELSQISDVKIKIVSEDIIRHILRNDIELLGCKATMSVEIDHVEKSVFEGMLVSSYSQTDEVSVEINLKDSVFAKVGQVNLKVPQGFGDGNQLENSYGTRSLLRLYKQQNSGESISQGVKRSMVASLTPELEQGSNASEILTTFDGKPSFAKNFTVSKVMNADTGQLAKISVPKRGDIGRYPEFSGTSGNHIEIVSGKGKGNLYKVTKVEDEIITLDRPVRTGDILSQDDVDYSYLGGILTAAKKYAYINGTYNTVRSYQFAVTQTFWKNDKEETSTEDISVFRFVSGSNRYAVPLMKSIRPMPYPQTFLYGRNREFFPNFRIINDDGTFRDVCVNTNVIESNEKYSVLEFPDAPNNNITLSEIGKHQPRWDASRAGSTFWVDGDISYAKILPANGEQVAVDSPESPNWVVVAECSNNSIIKTGLHVALYWRVDDLHFGGKYRIKPRFSFWLNESYYFSARVLLIDDAGNTIATKNYNLDLDINNNYVEDNWQYSKNTQISLTRNGVAQEDSEGQKLLENLKNLLTFDSEVRAKYIYLQLFFDIPNVKKCALHLSALPVECEREIELGKALIKSHGLEIKYDIASLTKQLCEDYGINADTQSFSEVSDRIQNGTDKESESSLNETPFIPFKHGEKFTDKLSEICRAANFSMFSDGSMLYAKYFFSSERGWPVTSVDIIKGSLEVRNVGLDSVATEWDFSANVQGVQKTLSVATSIQFPEMAEWLQADKPFIAEIIYPGYMENEPKGLGARIEGENSKKLYIGGIYKIKTSSNQFAARCELTSVRIDETGADALFVIVSPILPLQKEFSQNDTLEITPLKQEFNWREIVSGTLDIGIASARELHDISKGAFEKTKQRIKLDERYTKHQIAAFGTDGLWLQNFINTALHNSYAKTIVSFKVPLDRLPDGSLSSLLLRQVTLKFGRFRDNSIDGWIVGYSLAPAEDAVRIEVMNSEPAKNILFLDENLLDDQKTIDEREPIQEFYSEK
jgi:hypothetical protein